MWLQPDGASAQTACQSLVVLVREMFLGQVFSLCEDIKWPPRSSELTHCGVFSNSPTLNQHLLQILGAYGNNNLRS